MNEREHRSPPKVLGYGRVSTSKQVISPHVQTELCENWFKLKQSEEPDLVWAGMLMDEAVSGKVPIFKRPQGQNILAHLGRGDVLVVSKDSRAFRSAGDAEKTIDVLNEAGIRLVILNLNADTATPAGRLIVSVFAAFGRFERELIAERTRESMATSRRRGKWVNLPPPGWKLAKVKGETTIVADDLVRKLGEVVAGRIHSGQSASAIASVIDPKTHSSVAKRKKGRISPDRLTRMAVYCVCGWPPMTGPEMKARFGRKVFSPEFVREHFEERSPMQVANS